MSGLTDNLGSKSLQTVRAHKSINKKGSMNELIGAFEMNEDTAMRQDCKAIFKKSLNGSLPFLISKKS